MTTNTGYPEIPTTVYDLVDNNFSKDLKLRIINSVGGISIMVVIIEEIEDSFLVALPSKLMGVEGVNAFTVIPYMPIKFFRAFKSTIVTLIPIFDEFEVHYIRYLLDKGIHIFPEFISPMKVKLEKRFEQIKQFYRPEPEPQQELDFNEEIGIEGIDNTLIVRTASKYKQ